MQCQSQSVARRGAIRLYQLLILLVPAAAVLAATMIYVAGEFVCGHPPEIRSKIELDELAISFDAFKRKFGAYPPNFEDMDQVAQFVETAFPKYKAGTSTPYPESLDAAEALVFWLSGISTDPADPFAKDAQERIVFHNFEENWLCDGRYFPDGRDDEQPFVYFSHACYATAQYNGVRPYQRHVAGGATVFYAADSFQIVAAGRDRKFGRGGLITELSEEDRDNVVSFSTKLVGEIDPEEQ
jgi:hypothetical protein